MITTKIFETVIRRNSGTAARKSVPSRDSGRAQKHCPGAWARPENGDWTSPPAKRTYHVLSQPDISCAIDSQVL